MINMGTTWHKSIFGSSILEEHAGQTRDPLFLKITPILKDITRRLTTNVRSGIIRMELM